MTIAIAVGWVFVAATVWSTREAWASRADPEIVRGRVVALEPARLQQTYRRHRSENDGMVIDDVVTRAERITVEPAALGPVVVVQIRAHALVLADAAPMTAPPIDADGTSSQDQRNVAVTIRAGQDVRVLGLASASRVEGGPFRSDLPRALEPVEGVPITIETETAAAAVEAWRARVRRTHVIAIVLTVFPLGLSASRDVSEMLAGVWEVMLCFAIGVAASARPWWLDHAHVNARARARERGRVPS